jgi:hypothetical protein
MSRVRTLALALLPAAMMLPCAGAHAQARGPSAMEVQETGQDVGSSVPDWPPDFLDRVAGLTGIDREELASGLLWTPGSGYFLRRGGRTSRVGILGMLAPAELFGPQPPAQLDDAARASKNREHRAWVARLVGRFRLGGRVEYRGFTTVSTPFGRVVIEGDLGSNVNGVADCAAVGEGAGVHCIFNAIWPVSELEVPKMGLPLPPSEALMLFRPAVVVLGFNPDTAEIRAFMVADDSNAHTWAGRLEANTLKARRTTGCVNPKQVTSATPVPCFQPLEIVAEPDSDVVTMVHRALGVTIRLSMQRDPAARAEKPMPPKKVR